jgi:hypothetical protein
MNFPTIAHNQFWAIYDELVRTSEIIIDLLSGDRLVASRSLLLLQLRP